MGGGPSDSRVKTGIPSPDCLKCASKSYKDVVVVCSVPKNCESGSVGHDTAGALEGLGVLRV